MKYIQILNCSSDLGSCCSDAALIGIIDIIRKALDLFQIVVPILLLTMIIFQLVKLVINPDEKNGLKKITNRIIATVIVFFLPILVNLLINYLPAGENFQFSACWRTARDMNELQRSSSHKYKGKDELKRKKLINNEESSKATTNKAGQGSYQGQAIVNYALRFVGQRYVYGGTWNGSIPYTGTDCSGFVQGVYKHFGINLARTTSAQWNDKSKYTLVNENNIRAGDLVMYSGHVAILTGNGNQIVHASNPKSGIKLTNDYHYGGQSILGIMRINGVN